MVCIAKTQRAIVDVRKLRRAIGWCDDVPRNMVVHHDHAVTFFDGIASYPGARHALQMRDAAELAIRIELPVMKWTHNVVATDRAVSEAGALVRTVRIEHNRASCVHGAIDDEVLAQT